MSEQAWVTQMSEQAWVTQMSEQTWVTQMSEQAWVTQMSEQAAQCKAELQAAHSATRPGLCAMPVLAQAWPGLKTSVAAGHQELLTRTRARVRALARAGNTHGAEVDGRAQQAGGEMMAGMGVLGRTRWWWWW